MPGATYRHDRRRSVGQVMGKLTDEREPGLPQPKVDYETAGERWPGATPAPATVNWSAMGAQPVTFARDYARMILAACDAAEEAPRDFEPLDDVVFDRLPEGQAAVVRRVAGSRVVVEFGVEGEPDTWRERVFWVDKNDYNLRRKDPKSSGGGGVDHDDHARTDVPDRHRAADPRGRGPMGPAQRAGSGHRGRGRG